MLTTRHARPGLVRSLWIVALLIPTITTSCGGASSLSYERTYFETGDALASALVAVCPAWQVSKEAPPGEHNLRCIDPEGGGVLIPDTTGHYRDHPREVLKGMRALVNDSPDEVCDHFGGGPFLVGVNWWMIGPEDLLSAAAATTGAELVPGIDCP